MEYPKPVKREKKKWQPIKKMTPRREAMEKSMKDAYNIVDKERGMRCEDCGTSPSEHSHLFPKDYDGYRYIAEPDNIRKQCRKCHTAWEEGKIHLLGNGETYMNYLFINDEQYFYTKIYQMMDRITENPNVPVPAWAKKMIDKYIKCAE